MGASESTEVAWWHRVASRRNVWFAASALLALAHFARMYDGDQAMLTDTRYFTYFGTDVANGAVPHLDFFGPKTQFASLFAGLLVAAGSLVGTTDLVAVRVGFLGLAASGAVLLFVLHRTLAGGKGLPALLAMLPYLGFAYIGMLPATGAVPKLIMAVAATGAALAVARRSWFAAGVIAALAPIDWQVGVLACFGVFVAAIMDREPRRALLRSALGVSLIAALFLAYFAINGALEPLLVQVVGASFARGAETGGPLLKYAGIYHRLLMHCGGEFWLLWLAGAGLFALPVWLRMERWRDVRQPLVAMAVYHYGVLFFSLFDFQGSGDTMLLLHSATFFAGIALISLVLGLESLLKDSAAQRWPGLVAVAAVLLLVQPALSEPTRLWTPDAPATVTLQDQQSFARRLAPLVAGRTVLVLGPTEQLVLGDFEVVSDYVYWNDATEFDYGHKRGLPAGNLLGALLAEYEPGVIVASSFFGLSSGLPYRQLDLGQPGGYAIRVFVRDAPPPPSFPKATGVVE